VRHLMHSCHSILHTPMSAVRCAIWVPNYTYVNKISAPMLNELVIWSSADCYRYAVSNCLNCVKRILIELALIRLCNSVPFGFMVLELPVKLIPMEILLGLLFLFCILCKRSTILF
jgi:hypothetical protein